MAKKSKRPRLKPGSKIEKLYDWLKNEMVGSELLFTSEHAHRVESDLHVLNPVVYNMLQRLEAHGLISRKKTKGEKGMTISLIAENTEPVTEPARTAEVPALRAKSGKKKERKPKRARREKRAAVTIDELTKKLKSEIDNLIGQRDALTERIEENQKFLERLYAASRRS